MISLRHPPQAQMNHNDKTLFQFDWFLHLGILMVYGGTPRRIRYICVYESIEKKKKKKKAGIEIKPVSAFQTSK